MTPDESSRGGTGIVWLVFGILAFLLTIAVDAVYLHFSNGAAKEPTHQADAFDPTTVANLIQPNPNLSPSEVVEIQVTGLGDPNISKGIQQCFAFASPDNRQLTGPLARFAAMVRRAPYDFLMHNKLLLVGQAEVESERASVVVTVLDEGDAIHVFQFLLTKQHDAELEGCWMTDAVFPLEQVLEDSPEHPQSVSIPQSTAADRFLCLYSNVVGSTRG